jgi:two-component system LytT family sensor kinase
MQITPQNKQLVYIAGALNLLFLILSVLFILYLKYDHGSYPALVLKLLKFSLANSVCWVIDLLLLLFFLPVMPAIKTARWLFFYLPSYLITCSIGMIVAHSPVYQFLSNKPINFPISGPLIFVASFNTLSLIAIELIQSRSAQASIQLAYANMQAENSRLRMKSLEAHHENLKSQLHPHFLFNSLTALKSLIRKDPVLAEDYLLKLSSFLRFSISHNERHVVPLEEELKFSLYYLEMQKIRLREALVYKVGIPDACLPNALLPVFSLQLTIENAIKHNLLTQESPLYINIYYQEPGWILVENNIQAKLHTEGTSGLGLKNLSDRYKLLSAGDISIENDGSFFRVYLKVIQS